MTTGLKQFFAFIKEASREVMLEKKKYLPAFVALIILGNMESLYPYLGVGEESFVFVVLTILATLLTFVIISQVVLLQKRRPRQKGELLYFVPTFLLYNLYYSFLFVIGLVFLIVPGIYAMVFFAMVPFIAVLDDETSGKFFKKSKELVKKNIGLVAWASIINLVLEFSALLFSPIQNPLVKSAATFLFSIPDAFLTIIFTIAMVKVYYHLKSL